MTETGLIIAEAVFLVLLYLFIWAVVRASTRALRTAEIETTPPDPDEPRPAPKPPRGRKARKAQAAAVAAPPPAPAPRTVAVPGRAPAREPALARATTRGAAPAAAATATVEPRLIVVRSASLAPGQAFTVEGGVTIGRSKSSQVHIGDQFISHTHARVFPRAGAFHIEDLGSLNGTFVNGRRVGREAELRHRDEVRLGETVLRYEGP